MPAALVSASLADGIRELTARDQDLAGLIDRFGRPPMWSRQPGFATLVRIILEQQVSLASAMAAYTRLAHAAGRVTPARVVAIDEAVLHAAGLTRQKTRYIRSLATAILRDEFDPARLNDLDDDAVRAELITLPGVGGWSADIYLLMALRRPDVWPNADLALGVAVQRLRRLPRRPSVDELDRIAEPWRPWRAIAARILWHYYLSDPA